MEICSVYKNAKQYSGGLLKENFQEYCKCEQHDGEQRRKTCPQYEYLAESIEYVTRTAHETVRTAQDFARLTQDTSDTCSRILAITQRIVKNKPVSQN